MAIKKMFDLSARVALVTGAAGSMGSAIATIYADAGADLLLVDIDGDGLHRMAKELQRPGQRVRTAVASVGHIQQITDAFALLDREFGIPMGRLGVNEDIKGIALLLASDASSFITGALIPLDGGNLAKNAGGSHPGMPEF